MVSLLALSTHPSSNGQRFRIETWAPYLASNGIRVEKFPFADRRLENLLYQKGKLGQKALHTGLAYTRYMSVLRRSRLYDGLFIYREATPIGPAMFERLLTHRRMPLIYDIDDPIFMPFSNPNNPITARLRDFDKMRRIAARSSVTICINELIANEVRQFAPRVAIIPNAIDLDRYTCRDWATVPRRPTLGYSGSFSTMRQLEDIRKPLEVLAQDHDCRLEVHGGPLPFVVPGIENVETPWTLDAEIETLHRFDVGLAPAPEDEWNRYKSFLKVILYMGVGVPVIASRVGSPTQIIRDGENGFLASGEEEWLHKLRLLVSNPDLRRSLGVAGRQTIERDFALSTQLPRVLDIFTKALATR